MITYHLCFLLLLAAANGLPVSDEKDSGERSYHIPDLIEDGPHHTLSSSLEDKDEVIHTRSKRLTTIGMAPNWVVEAKDNENDVLEERVDKEENPKVNRPWWQWDSADLSPENSEITDSKEKDSEITDSNFVSIFQSFLSRHQSYDPTEAYPTETMMSSSAEDNFNSYEFLKKLIFLRLHIRALETSAKNLATRDSTSDEETPGAINVADVSADLEDSKESKEPFDNHDDISSEESVIKTAQKPMESIRVDPPQEPSSYHNHLCDPMLEDSKEIKKIYLLVNHDDNTSEETVINAARKLIEEISDPPQESSSYQNHLPHHHHHLRDPISVPLPYSAMFMPAPPPSPPQTQGEPSEVTISVGNVQIHLSVPASSAQSPYIYSYKR